jgi:choline dehydrogenase-like flavoprotein
VAPGSFELVTANIDGCLGCGYCNMGCKYGKKLSALDWTLPRAQRDFPGAVRILPDCRVDKVLMRGSRATGVATRLADGRKLTVSANTVVLSAGAIASSVILQRSGLGEGRAGRGLSFNMASPVTLDFAETLHSERGLQITHYLLPETTGEDDDGVAAQLGLAAGAQRALPATFRTLDLRDVHDLARIDAEIGDASDLSVNSAHPQGGNPMSMDALKGVVDPSFRVNGTMNVHVCDASVFPSSITVNPQLTVMALAAYAADEIGGPAPTTGDDRTVLRPVSCI